MSMRWTYPERLLLYVTITLVAATAGSMFTWTTEIQENANPLIAAPLTTLYSLTPALAIAAIVRSGRVGRSLVSAIAAGFMLSMWYFYATTGDWAAAVAFLFGWVYGIPAALMYVAGDWLYRRYTGRDDANTVDDPRT